MEEQKDVTPNPSSALEGAIASSPEVTEELQSQGQEPSTPQKDVVQEEVQQEEEPRVPYQRLKEVVDEKNWYKQQLEQAYQRQQPQQPQQPQISDEYAGMTPEEERFYRAIDKRAERIAEHKVEEKLRRIEPTLDAGRMELAQLKVNQFRAAHADIKPNSPEEVAIAEKITMGYNPDDAYWAVMGPRGIRVAEDKAKQQIKQNIAQKKQANVESKPSVSTPPPKRSWKETALHYADLAEKGEI